MNRRQFLTRLFGAAAVATLPALPRLSAGTTTEAWVRAVLMVQQDLLADLVIFGTAALEPCEEFPFVRNVDLSKGFYIGTKEDLPRAKA